MKFRIAYLACALLAVSTASAQNLLDAVRLSREPLGSGSRGIAMSAAMTAAANDYSALAWNPAALTLLEFQEFGLGMWLGSANSNASFLGSTTPDDVSNTIVNTIGLASPVETERGHLAFGLAVDRVIDYTRSYRFKAVNPSSSFLNTRNFLQDPGNRVSNYRDELDENNLAWNLFLTYDIDSASPTLSTPFAGGLEQSGTVTEEGGLNAFRVGGGIDIAENVAIGITANLYFGSYDYRRVYRENDVNGIFSTDTLPPPRGFKSAEIVDSRSNAQAGFGLMLGLLAAPYEFLRFGLTVETPTWLTIEDEFRRSGKASFMFNHEETSSGKPNLEGAIVNSYDITTPMRFGAGVAFIEAGATISGSINYSDMSQVRFSNSDVDISDLNDRAREELGQVLTWKIGAEYVFAPAGLMVRGGYSVEPSAYKDDSPEFDTKSWSAGIGILLSKSAILEFAYRNSSSVTDHTIYNDVTPDGTVAQAVIDRDELTRHEVSVNFGFRF
jgi:long-subunit fatty acid transport protein